MEDGCAELEKDNLTTRFVLFSRLVLHVLIVILAPLCKKFVMRYSPWTGKRVVSDWYYVSEGLDIS